MNSTFSVNDLQETLEALISGDLVTARTAIARWELPDSFDPNGDPLELQNWTIAHMMKLLLTVVEAEESVAREVRLIRQGLADRGQLGSSLDYGLLRSCENVSKVLSKLRRDSLTLRPMVIKDID